MTSNRRGDWVAELSREAQRGYVLLDEQTWWKLISVVRAAEERYGHNPQDTANRAEYLDTQLTALREHVEGTDGEL